MTYLESYGPLALLIYVRTQNAITLENQTEAYASIRELEHGSVPTNSFGRRGISETSGDHDFIQFLVKVLSFYKKNYLRTHCRPNCEAFATL